MSYNSFMRQSAAYQNPGATRDKQGRPALGSSNSITCRFQRTNKTIVTAEREREPIHGIVFSKPGDDIQVGGKFIYDGTDYRVMTREDVVDGKGTLHHRELMVQLWSYS